MSRSRLTCIAVSAAITLPVVIAAPAEATNDLQLYAGDGTGTACTQTDPCATIQQAVDVAGTTPATIHLHKGSFFNESVTIASGQDIAIIGNGTDYAEDGAIGSPSGGGAAITNQGALSLQSVLIAPGGLIGVDQVEGSLAMLFSEVRNGLYAVRVRGGYAALRQTALDGGTTTVGLQVEGGTTQMYDSRATAVAQTGGDLQFETLHAGQVRLSGGTTEATKTQFASGNAVQVSGTSHAFLQYDTFDDTPLSVEGPNATAVVVSSAAYARQSAFVTTGGGRLLLAATAVDGQTNSQPACSGPVFDGNYNSSFDDSCHLDGTTSKNGQPGTLTTSLAARPDGPLVDAIPQNAVAAFDPNFQLCPTSSFDIRDQFRPVAGKCDIGAYELAGVTLTASAADSSLVWRQAAAVRATVGQPSGNVTQPTTGTLEFAFDGTTRCRVHVSASGNYTCRYYLDPGAYPVRVTFVPSVPLHKATASAGAVRVGKAPLRLGIAATETVRKGSKATVRLHVINAATNAPIRNHQATLYFYTADRGWYRATSVTTDGDGRAAYVFTPGRNVAYQWRIADNAYYLAGRSPTAHTTVR